MLRSQINAAIEHAKSVLRVHGFHLPPFALWTPDEWRRKGVECDEIRVCRLGWDVTDFASGDFAHVGLTAFTMRNGGAAGPYTRTVYCEKTMIVGEGQRTPMHCHAVKQEDIICRAGGNLICQVYNRRPTAASTTARSACRSTGSRGAWRRGIASSSDPANRSG